MAIMFPHVRNQYRNLYVNGMTILEDNKNLKLTSFQEMLSYEYKLKYNP